jgi:hypothetical protein
MTVVVNDVFGGYSAPATSGSAPFTATDNTVQRMYLDYFGSPTAGDKVEFTMTFPTGTVTFRARWSTTSTLLIERVSTIPGTSNGTANASTTITFGWHGRSRFPTGSDSTTNSFTVDGELTPTAAAFAITGSSFRNRPNLEGRSPDTVGGGTYSYTQVLGSYVQSGSATIERYDINGVVADGSLEPVRSSEGPPVDVLYGLAGGPGTVGIGMWRDSRGAAGITVTEFEIETGTAPVVSPCASVVSAHEFYDPPRDLDGVATDTFPFMGQFVKHPASAAAIRQSGSVGSVLGAGRAVYLDQNILGQIGRVALGLLSRARRGDTHDADAHLGRRLQ